MVQWSRTCSWRASFNWDTSATLLASTDLSFSMHCFKIFSSSSSSLDRSFRFGSFAGEQIKQALDTLQMSSREKYATTKQSKRNCFQTAFSIYIVDGSPFWQEITTSFSIFLTRWTADLHLLISASSLGRSLSTKWNADTIFSAILPMDNFCFQSNMWVASQTCRDICVRLHNF